MPSYNDPVFGATTECQWISAESVLIVAELSVGPENLPTHPVQHDSDAVTERAAEDPYGFPWLT